MERLIAARKPVRTNHTKLCKAFKAEVAKADSSQQELESLLQKLQRVSGDLSQCDQKILDALLDDEDPGSALAYEQEYERVEQYRGDLDECLALYQTFLREKEVRAAAQFSSSAVLDTSAQNTAQKKKLKLPKIELQKFDGDVKDWLSFWSQFERIHNDDDIEIEDKFQYLIQATREGSRARDIVCGFPPTAKNYQKAIDSLKARFGKEDLLIEFYVRELLSLVIQNVSAGAKSRLSISQLYDRLEAHLRALESIGVTSDRYAAMLFPLVESCIPEDILKVWLRSPASSYVAEDPIRSPEDGNVSETRKGEQSKRLENLIAFLRREVEGEERVSLAQTGFGAREQAQKGVRPKRQPIEGGLPTAHSLYVGEAPKPTCVFCEKGHESKDCYAASKMPLSQKKAKLLEKKACLLCLKVGHRSRTCRSNIRCLLCGKRHALSMCPDLPVNSEATQSKLSEAPTSDAVSCCCSSSSPQIMLQTLVVRVKGRNGTQRVRAILDSGSDRSYIGAGLIERLGIDPVGTVTLAHNLFGGVRSQRTTHAIYEVCVMDMEGGNARRLQLTDQQRICGAVPKLKPGPWLSEIHGLNIRLSDLESDPQEIELLIGSDLLGTLMTGECHRLRCGLVAFRTVLGWVVMGRLPGETIDSSSLASLSLFSLQDRASVENLWKLEAIGITDPSEKLSRRQREEAAMQHFEQTVKVLPSGRYEVELPWKEDSSSLEDNRHVAEKRCIAMSNRLIRMEKYESYDAVFKDWLAEGIVEQVPSEDLDVPGYYLPHRPVFKDGSTTKVRPVFDASCKTGDSPCLNECLEKGPNMIELIPSALGRFRRDNIGVISDIKGAFLQILVSKQDRDFLRFVWWEDSTRQVLKTYRHCRVVFGVTSSPFLLSAVLSHLMSHAPPDLQSCASKLKETFYVDNCVTSVHNSQELGQLILEAKQLFSRSGFDLRGWEYSSLEGQENDCPPTPVLGILWDKQKDVLFCDVPRGELPEGDVTRRAVLSAVNSIFDPLGICCPVLIVPKQILQQTWSVGLGWDDVLPPEMQDKLRQWERDLPLLSSVRVPRSLAPLLDNEHMSFHVFCDACQKSYAAVIFLRNDFGGDTSMKFVMAKARVAPLKSMTIPRLELLACCIGARLASSIKESLNVNEESFYYWTDSSTALCWIQRDSTWSRFVHNREREIRDSTNTAAWRHIPGEDNPADLPSRGCSVQSFLQSSWWEGPAWLRLPTGQWPGSQPVVDEEEVGKECGRGLSMTLSNITHDHWYLGYFSRFRKIQRMVGWMLRFLFNARHGRDSRVKGDLRVQELEAAERVLMKMVQQETFAGGKAPRLKSLGVFTDEHGMIRVATKLTQGQDSFEFKNPVVLPHDHELVHRLILEEHQVHCHAGVTVLLSSLRERYWILKGRKTVQNVLNRCLVCKRHRAARAETTPVGLPEDRIREADAFEVTGVDVAGPLFLKDHTKVWILLFTCAVVRAVHLELISSLSTADFLLGLRRFIARRNRPHVIYSDKGTNFVGANSLLNTLEWSQISSAAAQWCIDWRFNPPSAPWWGGWWERMVKLVKETLRRVLGTTSLVFDELATTLCDTEALINARPLTYLSEDPEDPIPLTPSMFLQGVREVGVPDLDRLDAASPQKRLRYQQRLREDLRKRFRVEYLGALGPLGRQPKIHDLREGDVVLLGDDSSKRIRWPLARIVQLFPGRDGVPRVAKVKTASGIFTRAVQRLYPLEISSELDPVHCLKDRTAAEDSRNQRREESPSIPEGGLPKKPSATRSGRQVKAPHRLNL